MAQELHFRGRRAKLKADFNWYLTVEMENREMELEKVGHPEPEPLTLDNMPIGMWARVSSVIGNGINAIRLMEMGLVPGAPVSVIRSAPMGDPLQIRIRDYHLALRRGEARMISVTVAD